MEQPEWGQKASGTAGCRPKWAVREGVEPTATNKGLIALRTGKTPPTKESLRLREWGGVGVGHLCAPS